MRRMIATLLASFALVSCGHVPSEHSRPASNETSVSAEPARLQARAERVTIIRDDFGVPHVYGKTDADAVFGMIYAQAEDDFPRVERNYIWAIGRLAEVEGESALFSDLRARLYMTRNEAKEAYAASPDWLKELCDAWADGLNWYVASHPEVEPLLLNHFEPWMPMYFFEGSIGGDIEQIPLNGIEAFYGRGESVAESATAFAEDTTEFENPIGSNGFAIAGSRTENGNPLLLINPHTTFFFRGEVHMVSEEGLNAYGAVTWGQFFVYQGFNENAGWMHTSTRVDFLDEFIEDIEVTDSGLQYRYGDELRDVQTGSVTLRYREGESLQEKTFPTYRTHHGPITHMIDGKWVATNINWDPVNALRQSFLRTKQRDHEEFFNMMRIRTNSSNNTVYADSSGNIAYYHGNFVPRRDPQFDYSKPVEGSDPATDWQGKHELEEIITVINPATDWLQNCNSTPFTAAGPASPKPDDFPKYMAPDPENYRGLHAVKLLSDAQDLTLDSLIDLAYDPYLGAFADLIPGLVSAVENARSPLPAGAAAIETLAHWDYKVTEESVAMTLAHFYGGELRASADIPDDLQGLELVRYFGREYPESKRIEAFVKVLNELEQRFGTWEVPWSEVNRYQRPDSMGGDYDDDEPSLPIGMASGGWGALASFNARPGKDTHRIYGRSGNSFVAVVEFGPEIRAKTLLAGGQSGNPESPHFDDQSQRYADVKFKDVAYYRDDVEARATRKYSPGIP